MSHAAPSRLESDPEAAALAEHMVGRGDVMRTILDETLESAERGHLLESGRTACGRPGTLRLPLARFPRAVDLAECPPVQATGVWHTHATREQLLDGEHSLPDWGNIVFHDVAASMVVGLNTSELVVTAADREAMAERFRNVLGLDVRSSRGVNRALRRGEIGNPPGVRDRVRAEFAPLVRRVQTGLPDAQRLRARLQAAPSERELLARSPHLAAGHGLLAEQLDGGPDLGRMRRNTRQAADQLGVMLRRVAAEGGNQALGIVLGTIISNRLFGG